MHAEPLLLNATDTRARLLKALGPLVTGVERAGLADPGVLRLLVRPFPHPGEKPVGARIHVMTEEREISKGLARDMPNGEALSEAAHDVAAFALSSLDGTSLDCAEMLLSGEGVLMLDVRPALGAVVVVLVARGRVIELGRLVPSPETAH